MNPLRFSGYGAHIPHQPAARAHGPGKSAEVLNDIYGALSTAALYMPAQDIFASARDIQVKQQEGTGNVLVYAENAGARDAVQQAFDAYRKEKGLTSSTIPWGDVGNMEELEVAALNDWLKRLSQFLQYDVQGLKEVIGRLGHRL